MILQFVHSLLRINLIVAVSLNFVFQPQQIGESTNSRPPKPVVVATVNDQSIHGDQVRWHLKQSLKDRTISSDIKTRLQAESLRHLIEQYIVLEYLRSAGHSVSEDEVDLQLERITERLRTIDKSLNDHLLDVGLSIDGLRHNLEFQLAWGKFVDERLIDSTLDQFFKKNHRQFDGTKLQVAHILLRPISSADEHRPRTADDKETSPTYLDDKARKELAQKAQSIRDQIEKGQLNWKDAVTKFSQAASAKDDGDIGWISYKGPMPRSFTRAAFDLEPGEISQPVSTAFGLHLVKCLRVKPGYRGWRDSEKEVRRAATHYLFDWIVQRQKANVKVSFTGQMPYFDPVNGELVLPHSK